MPGLSPPPNWTRTLLGGGVPLRLTVCLSACLSVSLIGCTQEQVWFCQQDSVDCSAILIDEIEAASDTIHVAIAYFTHEDIANALVAAQARGVSVQVIGEASENVSEGNGNYDVVQLLLEGGVEYRNDGNDALMHHKFTIIDGRTVMGGSYNYTYNATLNNDENLTRTISSALASDFEDEFQRVWAEGE